MVRFCGVYLADLWLGLSLNTKAVIARHPSGIHPADADSEIRIKGSPDLKEQAKAFEGRV